LDDFRVIPYLTQSTNRRKALRLIQKQSTKCHRKRKVLSAEAHKLPNCSLLTRQKVRPELDNVPSARSLYWNLGQLLTALLLLLFVSHYHNLLLLSRAPHTKEGGKKEKRMDYRREVKNKKRNRKEILNETLWSPLLLLLFHSVWTVMKREECRYKISR
jgi:hypothetical protein